MDSSKRKLVRQLEQLQTQIDKLKQSYLSHVSSKQPVIPKTETANQSASAPVPVPTDEKLQEKNQKLLKLAISTGKENELYKVVSNKLKTLIRSGKTSFTLSDLQEIQQIMDKLHKKTDNWEIFRQKFSTVYKDFFEKLEATHPGLSKTEVKFCTYLRTHMSSQQIASAMDISMEAIRKNRYRIRKKLGLKAEDSLEEYIDRF